MIEFLQILYTNQKNIHNEKIKTNRILYNIVPEDSRVDFGHILSACRLSCYLIKEYWRSHLMFKHLQGTTSLEYS